MVSAAPRHIALSAVKGTMFTHCACAVTFALCWKEKTTNRVMKLKRFLLRYYPPGVVKIQISYKATSHQLLFLCRNHPGIRAE